MNTILFVLAFFALMSMSAFVESRVLPYVWWVGMACVTAGVLLTPGFYTAFGSMLDEATDGCAMCALVLSFMSLAFAVLWWAPVEMIQNDREARRYAR